MATYPFLSDEWIVAATAIYEEYRGRTQPVSQVVRMNMVISAVPFGSGSVDAHLDTSSGELELGTGHLADPDLTLGVDWSTAKAILIEQNAQAGMQAFMTGKIKLIDGDITKLMAMQSAAANPDPVAHEVAEKVQAITE